MVWPHTMVQRNLNEQLLEFWANVAEINPGSAFASVGDLTSPSLCKSLKPEA